MGIPLVSDHKVDVMIAYEVTVDVVTAASPQSYLEEQVVLREM